MRAVVYRSYGGPERLELTEVPAPVLGPDSAEHVLIEVHAASVNPVDWKTAGGTMRLLMPARFPQIPGYDVAGTIAALGPGVTGFAVGDRVHARLRRYDGGACAELTAAGVAVTAHIPDGMDFAEAAGLPLAGMTALQGLRDRAGLPMSGATERVLVVGASGGVGHLAVQIARAAGAKVVGVCSARNAELVLGLGAHEVVDYRAPDPYRGQAPFDIVLDCVGGSPSAWLPLLGSGGRFASTMPGPSVFLRRLLNPLGKQVQPVMLDPNAADLRILDGLAEAGKLRVVVDRRFPLAELADAWRYSQSGRAAGKIVIDVR